MSPWSRRTFLKIGAVGTAGAALEAGAQRMRAAEPRPWNEASGRALRKYRDPMPTVCRSCTAHCGLIAFRDADRVVQLQASSGSPTNFRGLCPRAFAGLERVYDPDRVLKPLRRDGPRGSGRWKVLSWAEALAELKIALARTDGERVLHLGQEELLVEELRSALGWTQLFVDDPTPGRPGPGSGETFYGVPALVPDLAGAKTILLFGARLLEGRTGVPSAGALTEAKNNGSRVHLFDSQSGTTGALTEWTPVPPGTEAAVAFGLARLLLEENHFDATHLAAHGTDSPARLRQALATYTPEAVAKVTGITEHRLFDLASSLRTNGPALAVAPAGSPATLAAAVLNHVIGAVETFGGILKARGPYFVKPLKPTAAPETWLEELAAGRTRAACCFISNANPVYDSPRSPETARAFADAKRIGTLVAMDTHLTETTRLADLFLPLATPFEAWGLIEGCLPDGRPYLFLQQPVTNPASEAEKLRAEGTSQLALVEPWPRPLGEARSLSDLLLTLVRGRSGDYGHFADSRAFLEDLLQRSWGPGSLAALRRRGIWVSEEPRPMDTTARTSLAPLVPPLAEPAPATSFALVGYVSTALPRAYGNSRWGHEIAHVGHAQMNRASARSLGIEDGERVALKTAAGEVVVHVKLIQGIHPRAIALPDGLGHKAGGAAATAENRPPEGAPFQGSTAPADPIWWEETGPGVSYRSLVPFRLGPDKAQDWSAVPVEIRKI